MTKDNTEDDVSNTSVATEEESHPSMLQIIGSVFAAGFGVQSSKNRDRDFKRGKAKVFIIAGIVFTLLFMATVITVVNIVLSNAGVK